MRTLNDNPKMVAFVWAVLNNFLIMNLLYSLLCQIWATWHIRKKVSFPSPAIRAKNCYSLLLYIALDFLKTFNFFCSKLGSCNIGCFHFTSTFKLKLHTIPSNHYHFFQNDKFNGCLLSTVWAYKNLSSECTIYCWILMMTPSLCYKPYWYECC